MKETENTKDDERERESRQMTLFADILEASVHLAECMVGVVKYLNMCDRITFRLRERLNIGRDLAESILAMRAELIDRWLIEATEAAAQGAEQALFIYRDVEETMQLTVSPCVAM